MLNKYSIIAIISIIIVLSIIPMPYYLVIPGQGLELDKFITTENGEKDAKGCFLLTSTSLTKANLLLYLYSFLDKHIELLKIDDNMSAKVYREQYLIMMDRLMIESQKIAKVVALEKAGYFPEIVINEGILVNNILDYSPAIGKLMPGDVITKVNETMIKSIDDLSTFIEKCRVGELIKIYFKRDSTLYSTKIPIIDIYPENEKEKTMGIGLYLASAEIQYKFPLEVTINLDGIKGPSAGLMISLEILNQLTENDLTNGLKIAGTGILDLEGNIMPVDGIRQKLFSAKKNNADVFLVPKQNYLEASEYIKDIHIISVENFDEVIMNLIRL